MPEQIRYTPEQVAEKLAVADEMRAAGQSVRLVLERIGVDRKTYYTWQKRRAEQRLAEEVADPGDNGEPFVAVSSDGAMVVIDGTGTGPSFEPESDPTVAASITAARVEIDTVTAERIVGPLRFPDWDEGAEFAVNGDVYQKRDGEWLKTR